MRRKSIKKILWPTDFSKASEEAFNWSLALAEKTGAEVLVRHVIPPLYHPLLDEKLKKKAVEERTRELSEKLLTYVEKVRGRGLRSNSKILQGRSWDAIVEEARKERAGFIVMGIKGESALDAIFTGSTFARVAHSASVPVIGIPPQAGKPRFERALVTTDLSPRSFKALDLALFLGKFTRWSVTILHVINLADAPVPESAVKELEEKVFTKCARVLQKKEAHDLEVKIEVRVTRDSTVEQEIVDFAETTDQSMIFMTSRTRRTIGDLLWGCVTEKVLRRTFVPVCVHKV